MALFTWTGLSSRFAEMVAKSRALDLMRTVLGLPASLPENASLWAALAELIGFCFSGEINVKAFGAKGDGINDDTAAIQAAINAAIAAGGGDVVFPFGPYKVTSGLLATKAIRLVGSSFPGGNSDGRAQAFSRILWYGTGTAMTFDGSHGISEGAGGGIDRLSFVQCATPGGTVSGTAVKLTGTEAAYRATWARLLDVQFEFLATAVPWDIGIDLDGTLLGTDGVRDVWIDRIRVVSDATATAAIRMISAVNVFVCNSHLNLNAKIIVTGPNAAGASSGIHLYGINVDTLVLDYVNDLDVVGGEYGTITNTINSGAPSAPITLMPSKFTNGATFVNNAGDHCGLHYYDYPTGTWVSEGPPRLRNNRYYSGTKVAGTEVALIGVSSTDHASLDPGGLGMWAGTPQTQITKGGGQLRPQAIQRDVTSAGASFTANATHDYIRANCVSAPIVVTLPVATGNSGQMFELIKIDASANAASFTSSSTINGVASTTTQWGVIMVVSNGTSYDVRHHS